MKPLFALVLLLAVACPSQMLARIAPAPVAKLMPPTLMPGVWFGSYWDNSKWNPILFPVTVRHTADTYLFVDWVASLRGHFFKVRIHSGMSIGSGTLVTMTMVNQNRIGQTIVLQGLLSPNRRKFVGVWTYYASGFRVSSNVFQITR